MCKNQKIARISTECGINIEEERSSIFPIIPFLPEPALDLSLDEEEGVLTVAQRGWGKSEFVLAWGTLAMFCWHWGTTTEPITRGSNPDELCSHRFSSIHVHTRNPRGSRRKMD